MTNTKTTKRSLLASVMALFLCFTMLLGTTFAWFTDSVTSANNIIKAGNLDIELYHSDKAITDEKVGESTKLFDEVALWEPGVMVWEELTVKNEGDLALKYQLTLNVLEATEIDGVSFASMLKVALVDDGFEYTRENVEAIAADEWQDLATFTLAGKLDKTENDVYGIVIWWQPSDNDNLFNMNNGNKGKEVSVQVGVTLLATQLEAENDAFGNDYDEDAWVEGYKVYSAEDLNAAIANGETEIALMADVELEEPIVIPAPAVATYSARNAVVIDLNGKTITGAVGRDAEGNRVHVIVNNGNAVIKNGTVTSAGVNGGSAIYNAEGATLTVEDVILNGAPQEGETWPSYTVNNYGTLTVTDSSIYGVQGIIATNNTANTTVNNVIAYRDGWSSGHVFYTSSTAKVTVNGGIYTNDGNGVDGTLIYGGETVINGGTFILQEGTYFALFADSKLTVNDGDFSNIKSVLAWGGAMTVNGGTFGFDPTAYVGSGYKATEANGVWTVAFPQESFDALIDGAADDATIEIPAGTYTFPAADLKAGQTLNCAPGTVFEGAKLNANGATIVGATFSNAAQSNTVNGIYKDCTFTGSNGLRWGYAGDVVVFENCVFSGSTYGVHFDGGATKVVFKNCTFSGFNAMAGSIELVTFEGCTFVANGKSNYNGINMWGNTEMTNCTFVFDGTADYEWIDLCAGNTYATFTNCVVTDGEKEYGVEEYVSKRENSGVITVDGKQIVHNASALQYAVDNVADGTTIALGADIAGDVTVAQKPDVKITIDGNGHAFAGVLLVDGKSATYTTAGLTIKSVVFKSETISADACIQLGNGTNETRYTCNVTVDGCTFDVPGAVGVKSYTGGDKNVIITGCTATANTHSLAQLKGVDGVLVENCKVYSKNGINFNNSDNVIVKGCEVDVKGYAVRFGESSGGTGAAETYKIENCTLKSQNDDGDAAVVLRGTADNSTLTIVNTTIVGTPDIQNTATNAKVVK